MGNATGKPGVMFYFDYIPALETLTPEQQGRLLMGIIRYAHDGTDPKDTLDMITGSMWIVMKPTVDRDDANYLKKVENARKSVQKREERRRKIHDILAETGNLSPSVRRTLQDIAVPEEEEPEPKEENTQAYADIDERNQLQQQLQLQQQSQSQFEQQRQKQIQRLQQSQYYSQSQ